MGKIKVLIVQYHFFKIKFFLAILKDHVPYPVAEK